MDSGTAFFVQALLLQAVFTAAVVGLVGRRFPARLPVYRLVAPGAVPVLLFALAAYAYVAVMRAQGLRPEPRMVGRMALAYLVLWLVGVLWASLLVRLFARRGRERRG